MWRHKAAESISKVAEVLSTAQIEEYYIPLIKRLSQGEWFTSRTSSAALYSPVYPKVSPAVQEELRKGFAALGADDTPMVRRAAARWLGVRLYISEGLEATDTGNLCSHS
jgi:serine/threonine-protein phosphatase 2A regulatory subunit A